MVRADPVASPRPDQPFRIDVPVSVGTKDIIIYQFADSNRSPAAAGHRSGSGAIRAAPATPAGIVPRPVYLFAWIRTYGPDPCSPHAPGAAIRRLGSARMGARALVPRQPGCGEFHSPQPGNSSVNRCLCPNAYRQPLWDKRGGQRTDARAWLHIHPATGELLGTLERRGGTYRWMFDQPHLWGAPSCWNGPLLREMWIWLFSLPGLARSLAEVWIGERRVFR